MSKRKNVKTCKHTFGKTACDVWFTGAGLYLQCSRCRQKRKATDAELNCFALGKVQGGTELQNNLRRLLGVEECDVRIDES